MRTLVQPRSFGTHDGSFHADEVTACSLLLLFDQIDRDQIFRTRNPQVLAHCDYVCDVGGIYDPKERRFDHHQIDFTGSLSSAGMVLLYLREEKIISLDLYDAYNKTLILGVDAHDNGIAKIEPGVTSFSQIVSNFLPISYDASKEQMDEAFFLAVDFVIGHLSRLKERFAYSDRCLSIVREAMEKGTHALIFDHSIPWIEGFFGLGGEFHPAQFVIMPTGNHWKLRGIPPSLSERMKIRKPLPSLWAGLQNEDLRKVSQLPGAIFCHKGLFISIWETKEDAIRALHVALEKNG